MSGDVVWIEEPVSEQTTTCSEIPPPSEDGLLPASLTGSLDTQTVKVVEGQHDDGEIAGSSPPAKNVEKEEEEEEAEEDQSNGSSTLVEDSQPSISPKKSVPSTQPLTESTATTVFESTKEDSRTHKPESQLPTNATTRVRFAVQEEKKEDKESENGVVIQLSEDGKMEEPQGEVDITKAEEGKNNLDSVTETDLQLDEYERKLRQNTKEALELVDRLCEQQAQEHPIKTPRDHATTNPQDINRAIFRGGDLSSGDDVDVDSLLVNPNLMKQPVDCIVLPGRRVMVLDEDYGLMLLSLETKGVIRAQPTEQFRKPECATFVRETQHILVLAECSAGSTLSPVVDQKSQEAQLSSNVAADQPAEQGNNAVVKAPTYERFICRFDLDLKLVNKIEAPKYIRDKVVISCRMCYVEPTKSIYMAVSTPSQGFLYELSVENKWTEVYNTRCNNFSDVQSFAVVGPITELLLVETNRNYVLLVSIYNSQVVNRRMIAVCERPDTLSIDETGNLFVFDRATCKVGHHSRIYFEKLREIALVERAHCRISAAGGLLAVLNKQFKELKLYRY